MQDGWALQAGTSHNLGQHFAKGFDIKFLDEDNVMKHAWTTSWGVSTRLIGGVVMTHGDDNGLKLPPRVAPVQVVIVPIYKAGLEGQLKEKSAGFTRDLRARGIRVKEDHRDNLRPGFKFTEWELKGVPIRIELGPKDLENGTVAIVRRDTGAKAFIRWDEIVSTAEQMLVDIQANLLKTAREFREGMTHSPKNWAEFQEFLETKKGFMHVGWDGTGATEAAIKEATKATLRCIPFDGGAAQPGDVDIFSGKPAVARALFARAY
jgi:prolyl-tRNA synthetase